MMKRGVLHSGWLVLLVLLTACGTGSKKNDTRDTPVKGTIRISVDESFKPVIEEQIKVHHSSFPDTRIMADYKSEADCFKDLQSDSTRMIIVAKGLTDKEASFFENKLSFKPAYGELAFDAIAVIVNREAKDSLFTIQKLKDILSGKDQITAVMDGQNATSTVRYLKDSILQDGEFGANVVAAKNNQEVIDLVAKRTDLIGFVGSGWISDGDDPVQQSYLQKIRLAMVECVKCPEKGMFAKASQATITYGQYPLARPLYYILKENAAGLGTGFMNFMSLERGQLIFRRASLVPAAMGFNSRKGLINK